MNCNCIESIEKKLVGHEFGHKKAKVTKAKLVSAGILFGEKKLTMVTCSELELTVEGYKKPQSQHMFHTYCPFCGVKIEKDLKV